MGFHAQVDRLALGKNMGRAYSEDKRNFLSTYVSGCIVVVVWAHRNQTFWFFLVKEKACLSTENENEQILELGRNRRRLLIVMVESEWIWGCQVALRPLGGGEIMNLKWNQPVWLCFSLGLFSCVCVQYGASRKLYLGRAGVVPGVGMKSGHDKRELCGREWCLWFLEMLNKIRKAWRCWNTVKGR